MAPGSGRWCANATVAPDVDLIETALACGTVARDIICAGLSEHRTTVVYSSRRIHEGMCMGCSRVRESPCRLAGLAFRTKRTTASEPANNGPRFKPTLPTDQNTNDARHRNVKPAAGGPGWVALPPRPPEIYRIRPIPERDQKKRGVLRPASGLGPRHGARVASPRCPILRPGQLRCYTQKSSRETAEFIRGARTSLRRIQK